MKRPGQKQSQDAPDGASNTVPSREEIQREFDAEFAVPGEADSLMLDPNELHAVEGDPRVFMDYSKYGTEPDRSDHPPIRWHWHWRPWYIWLPALVIGLSMFVGSFRVPELLAAAGLSLVDSGGNDWSGALRMLLTFIGLIVIAVASPEKRAEDWTEEGQRELEQDREYFHSKKYRGQSGKD